MHIPHFFNFFDIIAMWSFSLDIIIYMEVNMFKLKENGTNFRTELIAGAATFFTMVLHHFCKPGHIGCSSPDLKKAEYL